jgi:hypothetical protein
MCPFSVTVQHVPDRELGPLLTRLAEAGFDKPIIDHAGAEGASDRAATPGRGGPLDLPEDWRLVREREGESYRWPNAGDRYEPYRVFMGTTRTEGAVQVGLGETIRKNKWGRDRKYVVAFLSAGSPPATAGRVRRNRRLPADTRTGRGHPRQRRRATHVWRR